MAVPNGPLRETGFRFDLLEVQSYLLVASDPGVLPPGDGPVRPSDLGELLLIIGQPGTGMRRVADAVLAGTRCRIAVEIEHREALLPLVLAGVGVAVVADSWRPLAVSAGLAVRSLETDESLHVGLVTTDSRPGPAAAAMLDVGRRWVADRDAG
ncbi:LysR substrate-binding domain-containing protein [Amycolatopsis sp. NPDC051061]|uniref:LysR substrate-binding domain-containing protein n=1 Tax=Amycolatopsis sp. NPDC051061 TaxID=3155042 RepID=UPI003415411D